MTAQFRQRASERHGLTVSVEQFPEGTKTAADAAEAIGCDVAQIVKSVVLAVDDEDCVVMLTPGDSRVDTDQLAGTLDAHSVSLAAPDRVLSVTGYAVGGVPPFCHDQSLSTYADRQLTDAETVWAAAGTPETVFPIDPEQLLSITDATVVSATE